MVVEEAAVGVLMKAVMAMVVPMELVAMAPEAGATAVAILAEQVQGGATTVAMQWWHR